MRSGPREVSSRVVDTSAPVTKVLVVAGDAGGASALVPVVHQLVKDATRVVSALAYGPARRVWAARNIQFATLTPDGPVVPSARLLDGVDLLLVGTSANGTDHERHLTAQALRLGVPSLAVLDAWANYSRRFGGSDEWPDRVAVMDDRVRDEMIAAGFDPGRLIVTGQPALDELEAWRAGFTTADGQRLRQLAGADAAGFLVLYASSPVGMSVAPSEPATDVGYDTVSVLRLLIDALDQLAAEGAPPILLLIRPHPREDPGDFKRFAGKLVQVRVETSGHSRDWVLAADVVTGMTSMLLVEACHLQRPTISLQPGARLPDPLPTNASGLSVPVYTQADLFPTLRRVLLDPVERQRIAERLATAHHGAPATDRVLAAIKEMTTR